MLGKSSGGGAPAIPDHHRNLCMPGRFVRQLDKAGLRSFDQAHTAFLCAPIDRLWPAGQDRIASALEPFGRTKLIGWMGSQFLVAARKSAV